MGVNPLPVIAIILLSWTFQVIMFSEDLSVQDDELPQFQEPKTGGLWGVVEGLVAVVQAVWGVVVWVYNLVTFNVVGAPWYVRTVVGGVHGGGMVWAIAELIRGK